MKKITTEEEMIGVLFYRGMLFSLEDFPMTLPIQVYVLFSLLSRVLTGLSVMQR